MPLGQFINTNKIPSISVDCDELRAEADYWDYWRSTDEQEIKSFQNKEQSSCSGQIKNLRKN